MFSKKSLTTKQNWFYVSFSNTVKYSLNLSFLIKLLNFWTNKNPSTSSALLLLELFCSNYAYPPSVWFIASTEVFNNLILICIGGKTIFVDKPKEYC